MTNAVRNSPELKSQLLAEREELRARLARIEAAIHRAQGALSADFAEQAVERENDEVLENLGESTRAQLAVLDRTLANLEHGRYGICARCGQAISRERMLALRFTDVCQACA